MTAKYPNTDKLEDAGHLTELLESGKKTFGKVWEPFARDDMY